jgi:hypothetical protein
MRRKLLTASFALVCASGFVVAANTASADPALHLQKDCTEFIAAMGAPGGFCKIVASNLTQIPVGSKLFYDQGAGTLTLVDGVIDSSVILDAGGNGNRTRGRCTLDLGTNLGLCTFSDGTGSFAGFHARLNVSLCGDLPNNAGPYCLDGTYGISGQQSVANQQ